MFYNCVRLIIVTKQRQNTLVLLLVGAGWDPLWELRPNRARADRILAARTQRSVKRLRCCRPYQPHHRCRINTHSKVLGHRNLGPCIGNPELSGQSSVMYALPAARNIFLYHFCLSMPFSFIYSKHSFQICLLFYFVMYSFVLILLLLVILWILLWPYAV